MTKSTHSTNSASNASSADNNEPGPIVEFVVTKINAPPAGAGFAEFVSNIDTIITLPDYQDACDFAIDLATQNQDPADELDAEVDDTKPLEACAPGWYLRWIRKDEDLEPEETEETEETELPRAELGVYQLSPGVFSGVYVNLTRVYTVTPTDIPDEADLDDMNSSDEEFEPSDE